MLLKVYHVVETIPKSQKLQSKTILDSVHVSNNLLKTDILFMSIPKWMQMIYNDAFCFAAKCITTKCITKSHLFLVDLLDFVLMYFAKEEISVVCLSCLLGTIKSIGIDEN